MICTSCLDLNHTVYLLMLTPHLQCFTLSFFEHCGDLSHVFLNLKRFQWIGKRERRLNWCERFQGTELHGKGGQTRTDRTDDGNIASGVGGVMRGQDASKTLNEFG